MKKELTNHTVTYDIEAIFNNVKKRLLRSSLMLLFCIALLSCSILTIIYYGTMPLLFVFCIAALIFSLIFIRKEANILLQSNFTKASGEIIEVYKDVKVVDTKAIGGVGFGSVRKYDSYRRNRIDLRVSIKSGEEIKSINLYDVTEKHLKYYESAKSAIKLPGTRFPICPDNSDFPCLCPICGNFNEKNTKDCENCKCQIKVIE